MFSRLFLIIMAYTFPDEFFIILMAKGQASQHSIAHALPLKEPSHCIAAKCIMADFYRLPSKFFFRGVAASSGSIKKLALIAAPNGLELSRLPLWSSSLCHFQASSPQHPKETPAMMAYAFPKHFTIATSSEAGKNITKWKRALKRCKGQALATRIA